jgi:inosine-uridine nucleoside N-ribohydrolase
MSASAAPLRVVLDTDTFNEVDDQFALAHLLLSKEVKLDAVYAAPFLNSRSGSPADGMEKSFAEIHRVLDLMTPKAPPSVYRGSKDFLRGAAVPEASDAVDDLVRRALSAGEGKLHVAGIAAATNIASALLVEPKIAEHIVIVWLGGHASYWPTTREFNLKQDIHAVRVLLDAEVPFIRIPCLPVASHLITTVAELERELAPHSRLGKYLTEIVRSYAGNPSGWSKVIWDIAASAYLINSGWFSADELPCPALRDDMVWDKTREGRMVREARSVDRNAIFADFFAKARVSG